MSAMQKLHIGPALNTPEIILSPEDNQFIIRGNSAPEDVRALYYPVIEWISKFSTEMKVHPVKYTPENPLVLNFDLEYFNSASAKFIYDIIMEVKAIKVLGIPVSVKWYFQKDDNDMMEAGKDIASIVEMDFEYIEKKG